MQLDDAVRRWLTDVVECGEAIQEYAQGRTFDDFMSARMFRKAVEREFITIGEALGSSLRRAPELESVIADAREIVDFRNLLVHAYTHVYPNAVWTLLEADLPRLLTEVRALLE